MNGPFPLSGVIGIVAETSSQVDEAQAAGLAAVEVRANLLLSAGLDKAAVGRVVAAARAAGLAVLYTLRHPSHGGTFDGSEAERVALNQEALAAGADVVDAEWRSEAAAALLAAGAPLVLSHHDFEGMPSADELAGWTRAMLAAGADAGGRPLAIKVVPTAARIADAARMLEWVAGRGADEPRRVGFAMGPLGACSRILTIAYGAPITYASLAASVAPGQIPLRELQALYRAERLDAETRVFGIAGTHALGSLSPFLHNRAFHARAVNAVYVPFQTDDFDDLLRHAAALRIDGMSVTNPYKERALAAADRADERSRACGAANTLVIDRRAGGRRLDAFNTDFDGVLIPIERYAPAQGLRVAVIGNGGAARGAVQALKSGGAAPVLFYRSAERGEPVARALDVEGATLDRIDGSFDVFINATPLGGRPDDPSPVPASVFQRPQQIAFEMHYLNPHSRFMADAAAAGVRRIRGGEMLVAQGVMQYARFLGEQPGLEEFQVSFDLGMQMRGAAPA